MRVAALSSNAGEVLGFEKVADWHVVQGQSITLSSSATVTQGAASLAVPARGFVTVQGAAISISSALPSKISFDLFLPPPVNPSWAGATQLYLDCHSKNLFNQFIGQQELTGQPSGKFTTESFTVPSTILSALTSGCGDLSFTIAINVPTNQTGTYLLDNLQLGGAPVVATCSASMGSNGDGGVTGSTVSFSNQVTRADLGTLTLNSTSVLGDPLTVTRAISLNGSPVYQMRAQASGSGSSSMTVTLSPPITGVHQMIANTAGQTVTFLIDGRQTVPMAAGSTSVQFVDGKPAPTVNAPAGLLDAITQLLSSAGQQAPTCLAASAGASAADTLLQAAGTDSGHTSTVSGRQCNLCEWKCYGEELLCAALAPAIVTCSVLTSFLGPFGTLLCTTVVETTGCTLNMVACEKDCHNAGTECCPVDCGGARNILTPIGLCCTSGESCLKRGTDNHVALCCSPGQVACGGTGCCGSDTVCIPPEAGGPPSVCCSPNNISLNGTCCNLTKKCSTNADCPISRCGADGCCTIG